MEITLPSGRAIGPNHPVFIVCEIGSNWTNLEDCLHSIIQAKLCGADAVKFQLFDHEALYGFFNYHRAYTPGRWDRHPAAVDPEEFEKMSRSDQDSEIDQYKANELYLKRKRMEGELPVEWLSKLKAECDRVGIEFMCSAFSPKLIDAVDPYVNVHKVASAELTHKRILEKLREIGKPVFLSTGACMEDEIKRALEILGPTPTVLMYCVAAYPARVVDLAMILEFKLKFKVPVGYSDHTTDVLEIPTSAAFGWDACVIEKHVTFIDAVTPDSPHSLTADEFKRMATRLRKQFKGDYVIGPTPAEKDMITRHKRRLIATRDIQPGDTLVEGTNFGIYRSLKDEGRAMHGFLVDEANGKTATKLISAGDGILFSELRP